MEVENLLDPPYVIPDVNQVLFKIDILNYMKYYLKYDPTPRTAIDTHTTHTHTHTQQNHQKHCNYIKH